MIKGGVVLSISYDIISSLTDDSERTEVGPLVEGNSHPTLDSEILCHIAFPTPQNFPVCNVTTVLIDSFFL